MGHYASEMGDYSDYRPSKEAREADERHKQRIHSIVISGLEAMRKREKLFNLTQPSPASPELSLQEDNVKIVPLLDRVLVKVDKAEEKTASGIILASPKKEPTLTGEVIAVGDDKEKIKVVVGQRVFFDRHDGTSIKNEGGDFLLLSSSELIGIVE